MKDEDHSNQAKLYGIPCVAKCKEAFYDYIEERQSYSVCEVRDAIALALGVTDGQRLIKYPNQSLPVFANYVANALAHFSKKKFQMKLKNNKKNTFYQITDAGLHFLRARVRPSAPENNDLFSSQYTDHRSIPERTWTESATDDPELLETRVKVVQSAIALLPEEVFLPPPPGSHSVQRTQASIVRFTRDQELIDAVLRQANGMCEMCGKPAPFKRADGKPFLEVHHARPLAEGGPDTMDNALAVCPNCHRELHHGANRDEARKTIIVKIARIKDHPAAPLATPWPEEQ